MRTAKSIVKQFGFTQENEKEWTKGNLWAIVKGPYLNLIVMGPGHQYPVYVGKCTNRKTLQILITKYYDSTYTNKTGIRPINNGRLSTVNV